MPDLPPLASAEQLAVRLGYADGEFPTQAETDRAEAFLIDASELIRDVAGMDWVTEDESALEDVPRRVEKVCLAVAFRAFVNPEALSQRQIGDSSKAFDRARVQGGEAVYLTDEEERAVKKAAGASSFASVTLVSPWSDDTAESLLGS